jgi:hypothetical protein
MRQVLTVPSRGGRAGGALREPSQRYTERTGPAAEESAAGFTDLTSACDRRGGDRCATACRTTTTELPDARPNRKRLKVSCKKRP